MPAMTGTGNVFVFRLVVSHAASPIRGNTMVGKSSSKSKKPTHEAFVVTGEGESAFWTKIGGVWPHDDGKGFNVELIALPTSGRLVQTGSDL
jgi:hypothetical protein